MIISLKRTTSRSNMKIECDGHKFDSNEEYEFYLWLVEAKSVGLVHSFTHHPDSFVLSDKVAHNGKHLLRKHFYTADFKVKTTEDIGLRGGVDDFTYFVDVKGGFNLYNNHREFSINQKWLFQKFNIFINKVEPTKWFHKHWCPKKALLTEKTKQIRKKYLHCKLLEDIPK